MRAMVIGFPKSGTTTIHRACNASGLRSVHWKTRKRYCGSLIYKSHLLGEDPLAQLSGFDVVAQADVCLRPTMNYWPNLDFGLLAAVRRHHPECLFILNRRDPAKIVDSLTRWKDFRARVTRLPIPGLPSGFGTKDAHLMAWIEGHYAACNAMFAHDPHFLDFDIEADDARERLSGKLGVDLQWWGVANANAQLNSA